MILNILTTATPRAELHRQTLEPWIRSLYKSKLFDSINWFVNVDKPAMFTAKEFLLTKKYLYSNFYFIRRYYTEQLVSPTFSKASKNVFNNCNLNIDRSQENYFMWLEDDWKFDREDALTDIKEFIESDKDILTFTRSERMIGHPSIFRENFFDVVFDMIDKNDIDPEVAMMKSAYIVYPEMQRTELYPRDPLPKSVVYRPRNVRCSDAGRQWRMSKGIIKTNKFDVQQHTWINSTGEK